MCLPRNWNILTEFQKVTKFSKKGWLKDENTFRNRDRIPFIGVRLHCLCLCEAKLPRLTVSSDDTRAYHKLGTVTSGSSHLLTTIAGGQQ